MITYETFQERFIVRITLYGLPVVSVHRGGLFECYSLDEIYEPINRAMSVTAVW